MKGLFCVLEGNEFVGKTTARERVAEILTERGYDIVVTREPGGTPFAEITRELMIKMEHDLSPITELFLLSAGRRDHLEKVVVPALDAGKIVICDRHIHSTFAWQVWPHRMTHPEGNEAFRASMPYSCGIVRQQPLTFILHISPEERARRQAATGERNNFDNRPDIQAEVDQAYTDFLQGPDVIPVDGERDPEIVAQEIAAKIIETYESLVTGSNHITQAPPATEGDETEIVAGAQGNPEDPAAPIEDEPQAPELSADELKQKLVIEPFQAYLRSVFTNQIILDAGLDHVSTYAHLMLWVNAGYQQDLPANAKTDPNELGQFAHFVQQSAGSMISAKVGFDQLAADFNALPTEVTSVLLEEAKTFLSTIEPTSVGAGEEELIEQFATPE